MVGGAHPAVFDEEHRAALQAIGLEPRLGRLDAVHGVGLDGGRGQAVPHRQNHFWVLAQGLFDDGLIGLVKAAAPVGAGQVFVLVLAQGLDRDKAVFFHKGVVHANLVVFQTLSKAWGAAGIRLGMAFASTEIISVLNKIKYPYNVNQLTQEKALEILNNQETMKSQLTLILSERTRLQQELTAIPCVRKIYPTDANFILVDVGDADAVYQKLVDQGIIVRNRNKVVLCAGCLRITVGTEEENTALLNALKNM